MLPAYAVHDRKSRCRSPSARRHRPASPATAACRVAGPESSAMTHLRPHRLALAGVLGFSAVLELYRLGQNGWANQYYSAAVRSMLGSLHNFFFVSSDPGGLITVDKPPLGLWLQTVSAAVFGFHPLSLLVPEALCGVLTVAVVYLI